MTTETRSIEATQQKMGQLLARSATDADFRQKLLSTPNAALAEFSGKPERTDVNIVFIENTANATFVLPDPIVPASELSESELEAVAGGTDPFTVFCATIAGGALAMMVLHDAGYL